jgi:hypothetical protein
MATFIGVSNASYLARRVLIDLAVDWNHIEPEFARCTG